MPSELTRAKTVLTDRLKQSVGAELVATFVGGTHTRRFADNLLPSFSAWQVHRLADQVRAGSGGELTARKSGKRTGHAPYSSAALAVNAFGRWMDSEPQLPVAGLSGFQGPLRVEAQLQIAHGGGLANLDVLLAGPDIVVGVESKLTETFSEHEPTAWKAPYATAEMRGVLDEPWAEVLASSLEGRWQPSRLGIEQLIKHALAIRSVYDDRRPRHLMYVFWEPENAEELDGCQQHRAQVAQLRELLGPGADPQLHALTYHDLIDEWQRLVDRPAWLSEHLAALRDRYELAI